MRGRVLILVGVIVLGIGAVVAVLVLTGGDNGDEPVTEATEAPGEVDNGVSPQQPPTVDPNAGQAGVPTSTTVPPTVGTETGTVVIALQDLPRGTIITADAVGVRTWPAESIPQTGFDDPGQVIGRRARTDIPRESPLMLAQLVDGPTEIADIGSDVAVLLEPGEVAMSIPVDYTGLRSVAWGIQPGDRIDVIMNFLFIDVDEEFQTRLPNSIIPLIFTETIEFFSLPAGRIESDPNLPVGTVIFGPNAEDMRQRPRLVTHRVVQAARVLYVNYFPRDGRLLGLRVTPTPTPFTEQAAAGQEQSDEPPTPTPGPTIDDLPPVLLTVAVSPQDAVVLAWAIESQIPFNLLLRSGNPGEAANITTEAVTMRYMIQQYNLPRPEELRTPFATEPAIFEIERLDLRTLTFFQSFIFTSAANQANQANQQ